MKRKWPMWRSRQKTPDRSMDLPPNAILTGWERIERVIKPEVSCKPVTRTDKLQAMFHGYMQVKYSEGAVKLTSGQVDYILKCKGLKRD